MELTREEKKRILDATMQMMQKSCEFALAKDRMATMCHLTKSILKMGLDEKTTEVALGPYFEGFVQAQQEFLQILGVTPEDEIFWKQEAEPNEKQETSEEKAKEKMDLDKDESQQFSLPPIHEPLESQMRLE